MAVESEVGVVLGVTKDLHDASGGGLAEQDVVPRRGEVEFSVQLLLFHGQMQVCWVFPVEEAISSWPRWRASVA